MSLEEKSAIRYRFGPLERRGVVAGWRGGQIATVAGGLFFAVLVLRAHSTLAGAVVCVVLVATAVALATWPVGGRSVEEWAPDAVRYAGGAVRDRRSRRTDPFSTLQLLSVELTPSRDSCAGIVVDTSSQTYTAVFEASGAGFVLLGEQDKSGRVDAWAGVLASLTREASAVHRLQWIQRGRPVPDERLARQLDEVHEDTAAGRSYAAFVRSEAASAQRHEVLLVLSIHAGRSARLVRSAGGGRAGASALVLREVGSLRHRLAEARIDSRSVLGPDELAMALRAGYDSSVGGRAAGTGRPRSAPSRGRSPWPWPMGLREEWSRLLVDGTWHRTYWVSEWPRTEVGPDFLAPLLVSSDVRRSVSVVMEPLGAARAARKIEQLRTADIADSELRRRGGFLGTARRRREQETLADREAEITDGHAPFRFSGYVAVGATDEDGLEEGCVKTEQAAARCGLELRCCYGAQARAFAATLPLGRGLC